MANEIEDTKRSVEEQMSIMDGQIKALTGITIHLLCVSTLEVAVASGDPNFEQIARNLEAAAREKTKAMIEGESAAVAAAAKRLHELIFEMVSAQMKKEARILQAAAGRH